MKIPANGLVDSKRAPLEAEIAEARVCGILYERRPGKSFSRRCVAFVRQLSDWTFLRYAAAKIGRAFVKKLTQLGHQYGISAATP